ncbi:MAG: zinc ribbon domain-containing protein [Gammaproteobacteria bacterium]|nr:zinc ribbon domain-containing protein [Gammaproteobacteria bacterium]
MPIYGYHCQACGFKKDCLQKMSDAPLTDCPACGKAAFTKQVSAPSFRLSGTGWYETDFNTGAKKNLAGDREASSVSTTND